VAWLREGKVLLPGVTTLVELVAAVRQAAEDRLYDMREADIASVPTRRVIELARYGMAAKAPKLSRHPYRRKIATLLATVRWLELTAAADDALELFDVFMSSELIGRAGNAADKENCVGMLATPGTPGSSGRR
jgi:hypothetical protein